MLAGEEPAFGVCGVLGGEGTELFQSGVQYGGTRLKTMSTYIPPGDCAP